MSAFILKYYFAFFIAVLCRHNILLDLFGFCHCLIFFFFFKMISFVEIS